MDIKELETLLARVDERTDGDHLARLENGALIASECAAFIRENGPELLRIYRAWQGAAVVEVGELGTILVTERTELIPQGPENPRGYAQYRCYMREKDVCTLLLGDDDARKVAGQRVRLLPDDGQGA